MGKPENARTGWRRQERQEKVSEGWIWPEKGGDGWIRSEKGGEGQKRNT